jgi:ribosome recycling factor
MNKYIEAKQNEFSSTIEFFKKEISTIRTGRANPAILEGVQVDAYGVKTPISGVAAISVPDGSSILVAPWDKNVIKDVEKAITDASLGLGIVNEGDKIRLSVPKMTEDNRKDLVKILNEKQEEARIVVRKVRDEIKTSIESAEKSKEITEDDKFSFIKDLDIEIGKINNQIKDLRNDKEKDIMTI